MGRCCWLATFSDSDGRFSAGFAPREPLPDLKCWTIRAALWRRLNYVEYCADDHEQHLHVYAIGRGRDGAVRLGVDDRAGRASAWWWRAALRVGQQPGFAGAVQVGCLSGACDFAAA